MGDISVHRQIWVDPERPGVSIGLADGGQRWWVAETTQRQPFANHYAPAVWVSRQGQSPVLMVIDTAQSKSELQTLDQWRANQSYPEAVTAVAGIRAPFRIYADALSLGQAARLTRYLGLAGPPNARKLDARWAHVSDEERRAAMTSFFRWTEPSEKDAAFAGYSENLRQTVTSDAPLFPPEQDIGAMLEHAVKTFVPLEAYQAWLRRTDAAIASRRQLQRPPVLHGATLTTDLQTRSRSQEPLRKSQPAETASAVALATAAAAGLAPVVKHPEGFKRASAAAAETVNRLVRGTVPYLIENISATKDGDVGRSRSKHLN
ncbi:hypothetical protein [Streptodolium elevatio]